MTPDHALENLTSTAQSPAGNTIADGTYRLLSLKNHGAPHADTTVKETLVFSGGNRYEDITLFEVDPAPTTERAVYTALSATSRDRSPVPRSWGYVRQ